MGINNQSRIKLSSPFDLNKTSNISTTSNFTNASNSAIPINTPRDQTWKYMFFFTLLMIIIISLFMFRTKRLM